MNAFKSFTTVHPILFALGSSLIWFVLALVFTGIASGALRRPYGDAVTTTIGRLAVTAGVLFLLWRLGWLAASGVTRPGSGLAWLLAAVGLVYFASASLYALYGRVAFDFSSLARLPEARTALLTHFIASLSEELMFRGLVLYGLVRAWGGTRQGVIGSVVLAALLFALLHMTQVFTNRVSPSAALLLTLETCLVSIWWGALVLYGGSVWPAVLLHFVVNAIVAVQGLAARPTVEPGLAAYTLLLWFSLPLGLAGIGLLLSRLQLPAGRP